ncbi:glycosyl hydrolase [Tritrichomonas foetus]|uniref:alpha-mannosidase n=1 Tax=Tritrichomonas foetus TaxID=1144522 RepID=A0A1J4JFM4_9EUKA|nr:glycosyl hydrolase [Tritrichomonas foetus]|eukprot:OHS97465.1 glycosyl hydrolase [Tritrichomonas foetus]
MFLISFLFIEALSLYVVDPQHTINKLKKINNFVNTIRHVGYKVVRDGKATKKATSSHDIPSECDYEWEDVDFSHDWYFNEGRYEWTALIGTLQIPDGYDPEKHLLKLHIGITRDFKRGTGDDNTPCGPEGRYWINKEISGAVDSFHDGLYLTDDEAQDGNEVQVRIFNGRIPTHHHVDAFGIDMYDRAVETLYRRCKFLIDVVEKLEDGPDKQKLLDLVDETLRMIDIRDEQTDIDMLDIRKQDPKHEAMRKSVPVALEFLKAKLQEFPKASETDPAITILGYSHIDTMWLWPFNVTHFKTTNTASTMLHLLEHPPKEFGENAVEWKFLATAPQHYKWMEEDAPYIFEKVREATRKGRWNVDGVMWLEPDVTLPSGESLNRQILYGYNYFAKSVPEFNHSTLFLPDCFGYSASLPQILRNGECDAFVTSKISWNEYNTFPYSSFNWRGIDGSSVVSHFITTSGDKYGRGSTYTGDSSVPQLMYTYDRNFQKDIIRTSALHTSGNGDGGGGVTEDMVWNYNMFNELPKLKGVPRLRFKSLSEVMDEVRDVKDDLPFWDGELYLEYHRGTLTSFEEIKRQNRMLESHLHNVEWLMTILFTQDEFFDYSKHQRAIQPIWEDTMLMHFHDCIPGSSINEANLDAVRRGRPFLEQLRNLEIELGGEIAKLIQRTDEGKIIFNTLSHSRYITKQLIPAGGWSLQKSDTVIETNDEVTTIWERSMLTDKDIENELKEPFIKTAYPPTKDDDIKIESQTDSNDNIKQLTVTTPCITAIFDENGHLSSVVDAQGLEFLSAPGNIFELYEDRSYSFPAWELTLYHKEMQLNEPIFDGYEIDSEKTNVIIAKWHIPLISEGGAEETTIEQTITFTQNSPQIDFQTKVRWTQHDKILKIMFPTNIRSRTARFGIQFGHLDRPTHNNTAEDMARFEANGRWCDLAEDGRGIAIMADTKNGWDVHENVMRLSLLKAPMASDRWEDFGKRKFFYRAVFHNNSFAKAKIPQIADELNIPPVQVDANGEGLLSAQQKFVDITDDHIILETLKVAEDNSDEESFIARFYESSGTGRKATVTFPLLKADEWEDAELVSTLEKPFQNKDRVFVHKVEGFDVIYYV